MVGLRPNSLRRSPHLSLSGLSGPRKIHLRPTHSWAGAGAQQVVGELKGVGNLGVGEGAVCKHAKNTAINIELSTATVIR